MSAFEELEQLLRNADVGYLDHRYGADAEPAAIADGILKRRDAEVLREGADAVVVENDRMFWATKPGRHWAADLLRCMAEAAEQGEKDTAPAATSTPQPAETEPATVEFSDGTVTLTNWDLTELAPDYYGISHMQISGWLPEGWDPASIEHGTNHMVSADLPGKCAHAHNVNVEVSTKGYGEPQRFMKIQWPHAYEATRDRSRKGGDAR